MKGLEGLKELEVVVYLEEMCSQEVSFDVSKAATRSRVSLFLSLWVRMQYLRTLYIPPEVG